MHLFIVTVFVAAGYLALSGLSAALAFSHADAWTVWFASGLTLGLLLVRPRTSWIAILAGAFAGAGLFALLIGSRLDALGYGALEVLTAAAGAWIASRMTDLPAHLDHPRELAALVFGAALSQALIGALIAAIWNVASGGNARHCHLSAVGVVEFRGDADRRAAGHRLGAVSSKALRRSADARVCRWRGRLRAFPVQHLPLVPCRSRRLSRRQRWTRAHLRAGRVHGVAGADLGPAWRDLRRRGRNAHCAAVHQDGQGPVRRASRATWATPRWRRRRTSWRYR